MQSGATTQMIFIRHAPAMPAGHLYGRTDAEADVTDVNAIASQRAAIGPVDHIFTSPARRCRQTARALWPDVPEPPQDARLWEQNFGDWDGLPFDHIPDLGPLSPDALATHRPPNGESFSDLYMRVAPVISQLASDYTGQRIALVVHAGVIRAALGQATSSLPAALAFEIAPLSITLLRISGAHMSVATVNRCAP